MLQIKVVGKTKRHFMFNNLFSENLPLYEIMWKNVVKPDRSDDNIIRRMLFACWINKATNTHTLTLCNTAFAMAKVVLLTGLNIILYVNLVSCLNLNRWSLNIRNVLQKVVKTEKYVSISITHNY